MRSMPTVNHIRKQTWKQFFLLKSYEALGGIHGRIMAFISYLQSFLNFVPVSSKSAFISRIITLWMAILSCCANASVVQFWPLSLGQATPGVGNLRGRSLKRKGTEGLLGARK